MIDNYSYFEKHDSEQADWEEKLPVCDYCGESIMDEYFYLIDNERICTECLEEMFKKQTSDYMQE